MAIMGNEIGKDLCDALGLPKQTIGFTLRCYTGNIVTVECEYYPDGKGLAKALAQYRLVRMADGGVVAAPAHPAEVMGFDAWMRKRTDDAHAAYMLRHAARTASISVTVDSGVMRKDLAEAVRKAIATDLAQTRPV